MVMDFGPKTQFLVEFLSHIDADGRVIVLADLAELGHDYKAGDILKTYRALKDICESWDIEDFDDFATSIYEFVDNKYKTVRSKLGSNAMQMVRAIAEAEDDDDSDQSKKNKEKFDKEAEKRKKGENSPIAKAARSKGDNQNDMADEVGVHKSTISRIKTGKRDPSFGLLKKIKATYGQGVVNQLLGSS